VVIFDTTPSWNGSSTIQPFGVPNTATYGQTIIAPTAAQTLQSFSFHILGSPAVHLSMKAYVYAWSGSLFGGGGGQATGSALFASPSSIIYNGTGAFQTVTVNTGGTNVTPGGHYVMFLTVSNLSDFNASTGTTNWGDLFAHVPNDGGGGFVFFNNGNNFPALTAGPWDNFTDFGDLAFTAVFSVPEPTSLAVFGLVGLMGLGLTCYRRRRGAA
jgi:hypothetical protein